jgi:hypothetical protein
MPIGGPIPVPIDKQALMLDRYALGVTLQRLFGGASERSSRYSRKLPAVPKGSGPNVLHMIKALKDKQPERRPSASQILEWMRSPEN